MSSSRSTARPPAPLRRSGSKSKAAAAAGAGKAAAGVGKARKPPSSARELRRELARLSERLARAPAGEAARLRLRINQKENLLKRIERDQAAGAAPPAAAAAAPAPRRKKSTLGAGAKRPKPAARKGARRAAHAAAARRAAGAAAGPGAGTLRQTLQGTEAQLTETLQLVETLQKSIYDSEARRKKAERQAKELKGELETVAQAMEATMEASKRDLLYQIEQLQQAVLEYQGKYDDIKRAQKDAAGGKEMKARVAYLEKALAAAQGADAGAGAGGGADKAAYEAKIDALQETVLEYQGKCDSLKKQLSESQRNARLRRGKNAQQAKLTEEVQNLSFQLYYGQTLKDQEIDELRNRVTELEEELQDVAEGDDDDDDDDEGDEDDLEDDLDEEEDAEGDDADADDGDDHVDEA